MIAFRVACVTVALLTPLTAAAESPNAAAPAARPPLPATRGEVEAKKAKDRAQKETVAELKKQLEFLSILWLEVERTWADALRDEKEADRLEQEVVDLDDKAKRALLLIEQTEARRARALSRLRELEAAPSPEGKK